MLSFIEGAVGAGRVLAFEDACAYMGEDRACGLKIHLDSEDMQGADRYFVCFEPYPGKTIVSNEITGSNSGPAYIDSDYIYCPLTSELTGTGSLGVQVNAVFTRDNNDITVKSSVARIDFGFSLSYPFTPMSGEYEGIFAKLDNMEEKLDRIEAALAATDYGYITAAVCAHLLSESGGGTPLYFPSTRDEAAQTIEEILESITGEEEICAYVAAPAGAGSGACLYRVSSSGGSGTVTAFEGKDLLYLMKQEADI